MILPAKRFLTVKVWSYMKRIFLILLLGIYSDNFSAVAPPRLMSPSAIDDKSITAAYLATYSLPLYIPKKMIVNPQMPIIEFLQKNGLTRSRQIAPYVWYQTTGEFIELAEKDPGYQGSNHAISLDEVPKVLHDAKAILKSFLPKDDKELASILNSQNYIEKYNIHRLFTYSELQRTIREKKLTHVHLPKKFLIIKESFRREYKGRYLSIKESEEVIDRILKLFVYPSLSLELGYEESYYHFYIFAEKQKKEIGKGLNKLAMRDLKILCNESPFDIGYDNIFWDSKGDAIIIDTEYKGVNVKDCAKLQRYPVLAPNL
jgi:hypothetical protein